MNSRLGAGGGSDVRHERVEIDMSQYDAPHALVPVAIPEGAVVLSARVGSRPSPLAGTRATFAVMLGGEDTIVFVESDGSGGLVSSGPARVPAAGVMVLVGLAPDDMPDGWDSATAYDVGAKVSANGNVYVCTQAGTSAEDGDGPSGTGSGIEDGSVIWDWESALPTLADWGQSVSFEIAWTK